MNYEDVKTWVVTEATSDEMERITNDIKTRKDILVSSITVGDKVSVTGIRPKYLVGLTGALHSKERGRGKDRGCVMLDKVSTTILRAKGGAGHYIPKDAEEHLLSGIPMICLVKAG